MSSADKQSELKPCPCCGSAAAYQTAPNGGWYVECSGCRIATYLVFPVKDDVRRELAKIWNRRAPVSARALTTDDYMLARKCMEGKTGVDFIEGFADFYKAFALSSTPAPSASAEHDPWKEAVIDGLIVAHIYSKADEEDPRKALNKLLAWEQSVALDPKVSSDAEALIEQGRRSALSSTTDAKDAARYRFLRDFLDPKDYYSKWPRWTVSVESGGEGFIVRGEELDRRLDAVLSATAPAFKCHGEDWNKPRCDKWCGADECTPR